MQLLDRLPWAWVALIAAWLAVAPVFPEPHLVEKTRMLASGTLVRAIDIFDLVLHTAPLFLVLAKSIRWLSRRSAKSQR